MKYLLVLIFALSLLSIMSCDSNCGERDRTPPYVPKTP